MFHSPTIEVRPHYKPAYLLILSSAQISANLSRILGFDWRGLADRSFHHPADRLQPREQPLHLFDFARDAGGLELGQGP